MSYRLRRRFEQEGKFHRACRVAANVQWHLGELFPGDRVAKSKARQVK